MENINKSIVFTFLFLFLISLVSAVDVNFVSPTPSDGSTVASRSFIVNATIDSATPLSSIVYNWNNTNYTIYDDSLVLYYNFDNRSALGENATHVKDISKYGNNGTLNGTYDSGIYNKAVKFNGQGEFITIPNSASLNGTDGLSAFTISFWFNAYSNNSLSRIINKGDVNAGTNGIGWEVQIDSANIGILINNQTGATNFNSTTITYNENEWIYVTFVYNGTSIYGYKNGVLASGKKHVSFNNLITNSDIQIARRSTANNQNFNGTIDELSYYADIYLSDDEIYELYRTSLTKFNNTQYSFYKSSEDLVGINMPYSLYSDGDLTIRNLRFLSSIDLSSTQISSINKYFYGANTHGNYFSPLTLVDANNDGVRESNISLSFYENIWDNSKMNVYRIDANMNSVNSSYSFPWWSEQGKATVTRAKERGEKVLLIIGYMPDWLANVTNDCATVNYTCGFDNETEWKTLVNVTWNYYGCDSDTCMVETWNEPFDHFLLDNNTSSLAKFEVFKLIHNATYDQLKSIDSNIQVGANVDHWGYGEQNITSYKYDWFLGNFSDKVDFISTHLFRDYDFNNRLNDKYTLLANNLSLYGLDNLPIIISEAQVYTSNIKNTTANESLYSSLLAGFYSDTLNLNSSRLSILMYQLTSSYKYTSASDPDYPILWSMVSEPQLDNKIYPSYLVVANFSRYSPSGGVVYSSTPDYTNLKSITSAISGKRQLILTNTENDYQNVSMSATGFTGTLIDTATGTLYDFSSGTADKTIVLEPYEVVYLTEPVESYLGDVWTFTNYLNEPIRAMTDDEIYLYADASQITEICAESDSSFLEAASIAGILLTIILIGGALTFLFMAFSGYLDLRNFNGISMQEVIGGILIVGLVFLALATLAFLIGGNVCNVYTA